MDLYKLYSIKLGMRHPPKGFKESYFFIWYIIATFYFEYKNSFSNAVNNFYYWRDDNPCYGNYNSNSKCTRCSIRYGCSVNFQATISNFVRQVGI